MNNSTGIFHKPKTACRKSHELTWITLQSLSWGALSARAAGAEARARRLELAGRSIRVGGAGTGRGCAMAVLSQRGLEAGGRRCAHEPQHYVR